MIKYRLVCDNKHNFDAWFSSSSVFDEQQSMGLVSCPYCESLNVEKALMAPALASSGAGAPEPEILPPMTPDHPVVSKTEMIQGDATVKAVVEKMRELRTWVEKNAENVGPRFADEARKIHYGEEDARGIFGNATKDEAQALIEEGIQFLPLPQLPEENN